MQFRNRIDAGKQLAQKLMRYKEKAVVLAIPRGGLEVGRAVADALHCPLDCVFSKKIPLPFEEEVAIGAVTLTSEVVDEEAVKKFGVGTGYLEAQKRQLVATLNVLDESYRENFSCVPLAGRVVILVDDGIATGETTRAAVLYLREQKVKKIVLAVPVAPLDTWEKLKQIVDEAVCLLIPKDFMAIGQFYQSFPQLSHEEAKKLMIGVNY